MEKIRVERHNEVMTSAAALDVERKADMELVTHYLWGAAFGAASGLLLLGAGRIAGIGGTIAGLLERRIEGLDFRVAFLGGLLLTGAFARAFVPGAVPIVASAPSLALVAGGLLIGLGARLANGCTSGHGVCGVGRFSTRSLVATATFCTTGALTLALIRMVSP
jgi:uncharacterized protein